MTTRALASLGLKLLGVYAFLATLWSIPILASVFTNLSRAGKSAEHYWLTAVMGLLQVAPGLVIGFCLIRYGDKLAAKMVAGEPTATPPASQTSAREWQAIAFSVLGLYLMAAGFPRLAGIAAQWLTIKATANPDITSYMRQSVWTSGIVPIGQIVLGIVIFFKARALVAWWDRSQRGASTTTSV